VFSYSHSGSTVETQKCKQKDGVNTEFGYGGPNPSDFEDVAPTEKAPLTTTPDTEAAIVRLRLFHGASETVLDKVSQIITRELRQAEDDIIAAVGETDADIRLAQVRGVFSRVGSRVGSVSSAYRRRMWIEAQLGPSVRPCLSCAV